MLYQRGSFAGTEKGNEFFLVKNKLSLFVISVSELLESSSVISLSSATTYFSSLSSMFSF